MYFFKTLAHFQSLFLAEIVNKHKGDEHEAMACYNEALRLSPLNFKALYNRGKLRYKQGDYESALSDFAKAVKQKPLHATAHDRLGDTFIKLEMPDMAARHWAIAEELREKKQQNKSYKETASLKGLSTKLFLYEPAITGYTVINS